MLINSISFIFIKDLKRREMANNENIIDSKTIANMLIVLALMLTAIYYLNNYEEIESEVSSVIVSSLVDVNNSLAEHEAPRK